MSDGESLIQEIISTPKVPVWFFVPTNENNGKKAWGHFNTETPLEKFEESLKDYLQIWNCELIVWMHYNYSKWGMMFEELLVISELESKVLISGIKPSPIVLNAESIFDTRLMLDEIKNGLLLIDSDFERLLSAVPKLRVAKNVIIVGSEVSASLKIEFNENEAILFRERGCDYLFNHLKKIENCMNEASRLL